MGDLTAQQKAIMAIMAKQGGYRSYKDMARENGINQGSFRSQLDKLQEKGYVQPENEEKINYVITEAGMEFTQSPEAGISKQDVGLNDRQIFEQQGRAIGGIPPEKMIVITDIVWSKDPYDLEWVWQALGPGEGNVAADVRRTWFASWRAHMRQGGKSDEIPDSIKAEVAITGKKNAEQLVKSKEEGRDYVIQEGTIVRIGGGLGDFPLADAKEILAIQTLGKRPAMALTAAADGGQKDSLASLISALTPLLKQESDQPLLQKLLETQMENMKESIMHRIPQPQEQKTMGEHVSGFVDILKLLGAAGPAIGPVIRSMFGFPATNAAPTNSQDTGPVIQMQNPDGSPMKMNWSNFLEFKTVQADERRKDESHQTKMDAAKGLTAFLNRVGLAAAKSVGGE